MTNRDDGDGDKGDKNVAGKLLVVRHKQSDFAHNAAAAAANALQEPGMWQLMCIPFILY